MREEEKVLRQKLADTEKAKKQLQSDLASRERTIQQLKVVKQSSFHFSIYQKKSLRLELSLPWKSSTLFLLCASNQSHKLPFDCLHTASILMCRLHALLISSSPPPPPIQEKSSDKSDQTLQLYQKACKGTRCVSLCVLQRKSILSCLWKEICLFNKHDHSFVGLQPMIIVIFYLLSCLLFSLINHLV